MISQSLEFEQLGMHTWIVPSDIFYISILLVGGGGGGDSGDGGGGGECVYLRSLKVEPNIYCTIWVGAGGTGGADGESTHFTCDVEDLPTIYAYGGQGANNGGAGGGAGGGSYLSDTIDATHKNWNIKNGVGFGGGAGGNSNNPGGSCTSIGAIDGRPGNGVGSGGGSYGRGGNGGASPTKATKNTGGGGGKGKDGGSGYCVIYWSEP
jgi:hypothetical protein